MANRRVDGEAPVPAFQPVVSSPPPSEPCMRVPPHTALHGLERSPAPTATVVSEVPAAHSGSSAPVFTGGLLPSNRAAYPLDSFALQAAFPPSLVARDCHDYYESSATPRRPQRTVRLPRARLGGHRRGASHVHSYAGRQGRRSAVPRRHRRGLPQPGPRPRPPEQQPVGRDGPRTETRGPSTPNSP